VLEAFVDQLWAFCGAVVFLPPLIWLTGFFIDKVLEYFFLDWMNSLMTNDQSRGIVIPFLTGLIFWVAVIAYLTRKKE